MKIINTVLFFCGLLGGVIPAIAHDGVIAISGSFRSNTCVLAQDDKDISVPFDNVQASYFTQTGDSSPAVEFIIHLENCGADVTNVNVTFSGVPDDQNPQLLRIDSDANAATGLGVAILDQNKQLISLDQPTVSYALTTGNVPLIFYAQLRSTTENVGAGDIHASATFTFHYE